MTFEGEEESEFIHKGPCSKCGSSDANALYTDGHTHCFSCGAHTSATGKAQTTRRRVASGLLTGTIGGVRSRQITDETAKHFGYMKGTYKGKPCHIAPYYDADRNLVAQHLRLENKDFPWCGDPKAAMPFGYHCFSTSGKKLVLVEGELDALSLSQAQGNKWPVWSIACGADKPFDDEGNALPMTKIKKYIAKHLDLFKRFEEIIIMFDSDEQGRASARAAAQVIGSRAKIAELPLHDASDMLVAGRTDDLIRAMWNAQPFRPDGIVELTSLEDAVMSGAERGLDYPWPRLTELTYGIRRGELIGVGAAAGGGKTDFFTEIMLWLMMTVGVNVGIFALEQPVKQTARRLAGKVVDKRFHIPNLPGKPAEWTPEDIKVAWAKLNSNARAFLFDSFGVNDYEVIEERIRFMHHSDGVNYFFLDHLTALAASKDDERKELEVIMARMASLVKELNITIFFISHLATPDGVPHEEGGRVMLRHLKGSRAIAFWCSFAFGLERDQQAEDPVERCTTTVRILKDREAGQTGECMFIRYNHRTGRLAEVDFASSSATSEDAPDHGFSKEEPAATGPDAEF